MTQEFKFNVRGQERKALAGAVSEITNTPVNYLGAPTFAYTVGNYHIDKDGTMTGEYDLNLMEKLAECGFNPENKPEEIPRPTTVPDQLAIDIPLEGFTPEAIENLRKLVSSKEPLIKKALGAEELSIEVSEDRINFPWFKTDTDGEHVNVYAQFITALCNTAKEKKRVTAKAQESFENEKFTMRVWLIGLGMVGKEYALARKLLLANLGGNSSWRYGAPEQRDAAPNDRCGGDEAPTEVTKEAALVEETEVGADD